MDLRDPNVMNMVNMGIFIWIYSNDHHELNRIHLNSEDFKQSDSHPL